MSTFANEIEAPQNFAHLVVLAIGGVRLAVPEREVLTLELIDSLRPSECSSSAGAIALENGAWPVFCLNEDLDPVAELPEGSRVCVMMEHDGQRFGLVCTEVKDVRTDQVRLENLPDCMLNDGPVWQIAVASDRLFCVTTVRSLAAYLQARGCEFTSRQTQRQPQTAQELAND